MGMQQSSGSSSQSSFSSSFAGIEDTESKAVLKDLIKQLQGGGTAAMRQAQADRGEAVGYLRSSLKDFTKRNAFQDAVDLMASQLASSMESNKPAIQRAMTSAGTSAGSMQALLAQRLATDSSRAAGALGAEQARAYGSITASLLNTFGQLASRGDPAAEALLKALDLNKISRQSSSSFGSSTQQSSGSSQGGDGGGGGGGRSMSVGNTRGGGKSDAINYGDYGDYGREYAYQQSNDGGFINAVPIDYGDFTSNDNNSPSYVPVYSRPNTNNSNIYSQNTSNGITTTSYEDQPDKGAANYYGSNSDTYANYYNSAQGATNRAADEEYSSYGGGSYYDW